MLARALAHWHDTHPQAGLQPDLWAYAAVPNVASQQVLQKAGFEFVDHRDHYETRCAFYVRPPRRAGPPATQGTTRRRP